VEIIVVAMTAPIEIAFAKLRALNGDMGLYLFCTLSACFDG
jgi:hypothetical protein